ncbi:TonB-dependent siderophore receptor [uncultured Roseobacter sp.]|uniref:TonB-dependent siderophore receptor n=1 Tax=uncultured Roseobacter sp. TaxID=114847 RepID=UPI002615EF04|nr:TonB-dependent siderophore receptor [uncultured Roseobacter sp.]
MTLIASYSWPALAQDQDDEAFLGTIVIQAINDGGEGVSDVEAANSAGARVPVDPGALPRSVTILPRELFEAQGARTMEEAVAYSPGIATETFGQDNRYDEYILRGFEAQIGGTYRDGMPLRTFDWAAWRTEPFGLESVNILRGPTSDLYGTNQPGGLINGVTKRPQFSFGGTVQTTVTNEGGTEIGLDVTGPLSDAVAYRFVGLLNRSGTVYDEVDTGRTYLAPSLTFAPTDATTLTVYGQYQKDDIGDTYVLVPQYGSLLPNPTGQFGPGTYTGNPDTNTVESTQNYLGYELDHRLSSSWSLMSRLRVSENDWNNETEFPAAFVNLNSVLGLPGAQPEAIDTAIMTKFDVDQDLRQRSADNALRYRFETGQTRGQMAFGLDYFDLDSDTAFGYGYRGERNLLTGAITNFLAASVPAELPAERRTELDQVGLYATGHMEIDDRFIVSGGVRHDRVSFKQRGFTTGLSGVLNFDTAVEQSANSVNVGFGYRVTPDLMAYGSLARSFDLPPGGTTSSGAALDLESAKSAELGLKFTAADGNTGFNAALFQITKNDVAFDDPSTTAPLVFTQVGQVRTRGVELEMTHDFQNGFSLFGSMTYVDGEITRDASFAGNRPARAPELSAALFLQYEVPQVDGLSFGVGARYTGSRFSDIGNELEVASVTLFDASVSYKVNDWQISLSGRNLANREYIGFCGDAFFSLPPAGNPLNQFSGSCVYGAGREIALSVQRTF